MTVTTTPARSFPNWLKRLLPIILGSLIGLFAWPFLVGTSVGLKMFENAPAYIPRLAVAGLAITAAYVFFDILKTKKAAIVVFVIFFAFFACVSDTYLSSKVAGLFQPATTTATATPTPNPSPAAGASSGTPSPTILPAATAAPGGTRIP